MKKIFLICLSAGFISTGFAQSSVTDGPAKIKQTAPAAKTQAAPTEQKVATPQPVLNSVGLDAHAQSVQPAPVVTKPVQVSSAAPTTPRFTGVTGTQADMAPTTTDQKPVSTSVAPVNTKPAAAQADKTIPGTLVQIPVISISTSADVQPAAPVNTNKMPQQKISQDVQKTEAEIPASVAPLPVKKPAVLQKEGGK